HPNGPMTTASMRSAPPAARSMSSANVLITYHPQPANHQRVLDLLPGLKSGDSKVQPARLHETIPALQGAIRRPIALTKECDLPIAIASNGSLNHPSCAPSPLDRTQWLRSESQPSLDECQRPRTQSCGEWMK